MTAPMTIPAFYVASFLDFAIHDETVKQEILKKTELLSVDLDATQLISVPTLVQLIKNIYAYNPSASLGVDFGRHLSPISHGILSQAVLSSSCLRDIVLLVSRYSVLRTSLVGISFSEGSKYSEIKLDNVVHAETGLVSDLLIDIAISCIISVFEFVTGGRFVSSKVLLARDKSLQNTALSFSCEKPPVVKYQQDRNAIVFSSQLLASDCSFSDKEIFNGVLRQCETELNMLSAQATLSEQLKALVRKDLIKFSNCGNAANYFNVTTRTLRRRLEKQGHSYKAIVDEARKERAEYLLCHTTFSISHIAEILGFNDTSSFGKAFRKYVGQSPSSYRRAYQSVS